MFQAEIVKRLNGICAQVLPYLSQEVSKPPAGGSGVRPGHKPALCELSRSEKGRSWSQTPAAQTPLTPLSGQGTDK